ncbi:hypothetical protein [Siccirubricoccus sp. G192]|uniref:hypothetical protein n=1 Tax=Siccirubricoccus sp. G192 TaxID=2849651 RepID=UPI0020C3CBF2|nr:hypothetical protein [Siccirubricoccus sp. G192]
MLAQQHQCQDRALHGLSLGIGRAHREAAMAEGHDEQVGAEDLAQPAGRAKQQEGQVRRRKPAAPGQQIGAEQQHPYRHAVEIAHHRRAIHRKLAAQLLLQGGAPALEQGRRQGDGQPDRGEDHCGGGCGGADAASTPVPRQGAPCA